jgi:hypothetical protein
MTFADFDSYEDECISEEMLARLHNATEESVLALVASGWNLTLDAHV